MSRTSCPSIEYRHQLNFETPKRTVRDVALSILINLVHLVLGSASKGLPLPRTVSVAMRNAQECQGTNDPE